MNNTKEVLIGRFVRLERQYQALSDYHRLIEELLKNRNIYEREIFENLDIRDRALLDAYLKRFASVQDFLGAKIFPLLVDISGLTADKMTETLFVMEREEIIDSLDTWIDIRAIRNELEHDYPRDLDLALKDLKFCIDHFSTLEKCYRNTREFADRFTGDR